MPGDKQVFLYWDNIAEESRDPFLGFEDGDPTKGAKKDFEGYLVYKSKDPEFNDIKIITDSKGAPKYWKPIAQYDLVDSIMGPDPVGINGARFWRGDDTGLQYSYVDKDVLNGQRYYYALVTYDQGDPNFGTTGLQPPECSKIISQDFAGNIQFIDINCAVVIPNAPVAGYVPPSIIGDLSQVTEGLGTGNMSVNILNPEAILDGAQYKIVFKSTDDYPIYKTQSVDIIKTYNGVTDTLIKNLNTTSIGSDRISPPFDGMNISIKNDTLISVSDSLQCVPCRVGLKQMYQLLDRITLGLGTMADLEKLESLAHTVGATSLCGLGQTAPNPVLSTLKYFRHEYLEHTQKKECKAGVCAALYYAPCENACPSSVDAASYVSHMSEGRLQEAYFRHMENNPFPIVCGRVCPAFCEKKCSRGKYDEAIAIREIKRLFAEWAIEQGIGFLPPKNPKKEKVAIIGAGAAGLSCGFYLTRLGYKPVVFESQPVSGGMMRLGIPAFRLPHEKLQAEIDVIAQAGVEIRLNSPVKSLVDLRKQGFQAIFIGVGAWQAQPLNLAFCALY